MTVAFRPRPSVVRRDSGLYGYERALARRGLAPIAGVDEAGRGACAGPLVVAAVILRRRIDGLERLQAAHRRRCANDSTSEIMATAHVGVVVIPPGRSTPRDCTNATSRECGEPSRGCPVTLGTSSRMAFPVPGLPAPSLAVWKGDQVAACVAAASIVAKVTRDRMMVALDERHPAVRFRRCTRGTSRDEHRLALETHGPCPRTTATPSSTVAPGGMGENELGAGVA